MLLPTVVAAAVEPMFDPTFNAAGETPGICRFVDGTAGSPGAEDQARGITVQSDGKIVITGSISVDLRLTSAGGLDPTFNAAGDTPGIFMRSDASFDAAGRGVAIQSDGKIVVIGGGAGVSTYDLYIWRLTTSGALDATFSVAGDTPGVFVHDVFGGMDNGNAVAVKSDGKIIVVGECRNAANTNADLGVWCLTPTGTLDATFNAAGETPGLFTHNAAAGNPNGNERGWAVALQGDGKIVIVSAAGNLAGNDDVVVWRLNSNGTLDGTFNAGGDTPGVLVLKAIGGVPNANEMARGVAIQSDGKIVVAGDCMDAASPGEAGMFVSRLTSAGMLDATFNAAGNTPGIFVHSSGRGGLYTEWSQPVLVRSDGKIVVVGGGSRRTPDEWLVELSAWRLNADGTLDTTFNAAGDTPGLFCRKDLTSRTTDGEIGWAAALQADGKIVVAGNSDSNANYDLLVWRLDPNRIAEETALPVSEVVTPSETTATVTAPVGTTETFVQIELSGGGTTSGTLVDAANTTGAGANYVETTTLVNPDDTLTAYIWTGVVTPAFFLGLRSDTGNLNARNFPPGLRNDDTSRRAFGATIVLTEFSGSSGTLIGDTTTTSYIGDQFAYTLSYTLSETTTRLFRHLGFDTAPGASAFAFYFADTYGGAWTRDSSVTVTVSAGTAGGIRVHAKGITRDLPGGLGGAGGATPAAKADGLCLLECWGAPRAALAVLRAFRDRLMATALGRIVTALYYLA